MDHNSRWKGLGWRHPVWELVRYYRALRGASREWLETLRRDGVIRIDSEATLTIDRAHVDVLAQYLDASGGDLENAFGRFRTEAEANTFCKKLGVKVKTTKTRSKAHHQSSKALI